MTELRDVLQQRAHDLAASMRDTQEFDAFSASRSVRRRRVARATLVSAATGFAMIGVAGGAWALATRDSAEPIGTPSPSPSVTPSGTPSPSPTVGAARLTQATDAERLDLAANPRTSEEWIEPSLFATELAIADPEYWVLVKVGHNGDSDIVAVAPRRYELFSGGRPIAALLEIDDAGARAIECPMPIDGELCSHLEQISFGPDVQLDSSTFYDTLVLPSVVSAAGGVEVGIGTDAPLGDASDWTDFVTADPDYNPVPWANAVDDTAIGASQSTLVRAYSTAAVSTLDAFDYAIRTPFGSYMRLLDEGIGGLSAEGFSWDDGEPLDLYDETVCANWGDGACPDSWVSAEQRCFPLAVTEDPAHKDSEWTASGATADGRLAYLPVTGGNATAREIYITMRDSSWDIESDEMNYTFSSYAEFLQARSVITFQLDDGRWVIGLSPSARNNPYECA